MNQEVKLRPLDVDSFVREATQNDIPDIAKIWLEGVAAAFGTKSIELPNDLQLHDHFAKMVIQGNDTFKFWVCVTSEGSMLGWSTVQPFHTTPLESARDAYGFISTYMSNASRGKGLGGKLLDFVIGYCREHTRIAHVIGIQDRSNLASVRISDRAGFLDFGLLPPSERVSPASIIVCPIA